jgi:hypothetical protein
VGSSTEVLSNGYSTAFHMPIVVRAVVAATFLAAACSSAQSPKQATESTGSHPATRDQVADSSIIDRATTLETLVPEVADRVLYEAQGSETDAGRRSYTFALKPQPSLDSARHFQIVTVTWAPVNEAATRGDTPSVLAGTGGPNGSFVEEIQHTRDNKYAVRDYS